MVETVATVEGVRVANNHHCTHVFCVRAHQIGFNIDAINSF
jgi:hypothetical protein